MTIPITIGKDKSDGEVSVEKVVPTHTVAPTEMTLTQVLGKAPTYSPVLNGLLAASIAQATPAPPPAPQRTARPFSHD